jgi:prepilin-type N-terminal cleavage/methylation domain-containing protein
MKKAFTLIELLVVIGIISVLLALCLPVMRRVREQGGETVCRSSLRQMAMALKTYSNNNDNLFPPPTYIYHSVKSFDLPHCKIYLPCCRWHDARIGLDSELLRHEHPEWRGSLWPYLQDTRIVRCRVGVLANIKRGCNNACCCCVHNPKIDVVPQYTYTMNAYLGSTIMTGTSMESIYDIDKRTIRTTDVRKDTQVTRSPSQVFAFGEENSWAINTEGRQPLGVKREWAAPYNLSGKFYLERCPPPPGADPGEPGTIVLGSLDVHATYQMVGSSVVFGGEHIGDAFATCHRPIKGDLNTGHSYVVMLDEHVEKVTVADQLRRSRRVSGMEESRLGPGGNMALSWPLEIPPPGGWDNQ